MADETTSHRPLSSAAHAPARVALELAVGVAKVSKWAVRESGDTLEVIERPHGGLSLVLADGQGSGQAAKDLSNLVAKKAVSLLADGVRDGAVARAVHDFLYHYRHGQVSATLNIVSADLVSKTLVISRNNPCPAILLTDGEVHVLSEPSTAIGMHRRMKPVVVERPITLGTWLVVYTDGIESAGRKQNRRLDVLAEVQGLVAQPDASPLTVAEGLLQAAVALDQGRPSDDTSVVALAVVPGKREDLTRRMAISFPVG
jgi:serine phosphatase RsbU (regulator of sigma subunit)